MINSYIDDKEILLSKEIEDIIFNNTYIWRFTTPSGDKYTFNFTDVADGFKRPLAEYMAIVISNVKDIKISTAYKRFLMLKKFISYIAENINKIEDLEMYHIVECISEEELNEESKLSIKEYSFVIYEFLKYYKKIIKPSVFEEICEVKNFHRNDTISSTKYKLLPRNFYDCLISLAIKTMNNKLETIETRINCCLLIIQSQLGLRTCELLNLEINNIIGTPDLINGSKIKYKVFKTASKKSGYRETYSFLNPLALIAWSKLYHLGKAFRNNNILYVSPNIEYKSFQDFLIKFCLNHNKVLSNINNLLYNECMHSKYITEDYFGNTEFKDTDVVSYPVTYQFRVYRIHELAIRGVPLQEIANTVSHHSPDMTYSYTRIKEDYHSRIIKKKYGYYSEENLRILISLAKQSEEFNNLINNEVPNGICHKEYCEFKNYVKSNF